MFMLPELALGIALLVGLHLTAGGSITVGQLASYFATATLVVGPVRMLGMLLGQAVNATTALDRHYEVMDPERHHHPRVLDARRPVGRDRCGGAARCALPVRGRPRARPGRARRREPR